MATQAKSNRNPAAKAAGSPDQALHVTPKAPGFRRAGRAFPDGETVIPMADLTEEEYAQLTNEPMLVTYVKDIVATAKPE